MKHIKSVLRNFISMKIMLLCLCCVAGLFARAQKNEISTNPVDYKGACVLTAPNVKLAGNSVADALKFITAYSNNIKAEQVGVILKHTTQSPGGLHYTFYQTYAGVEVYQSDIKVNMDRSSIVRSVLDNSFDTKHWKIDVSGAKTNSVIAIIPGTEQAVLAEVVMNGHYEQLVYKGEVIYNRDINSYATDSVVTGKVFYPDPLTTAQQIYGGTYRNNGDSNAVWLVNQQRNVSFKADYSGGIFRLKNQYVTIEDFSATDLNLPVVTSNTPVFNFNRSQSGFEDVNVYYHLSRYRSHVDSLGFDMANRMIYADPHAIGEDEDQSFFSPDAFQPKLYFGMGGVDDAEDADVIVHEYGHFLSYNASPGSNNGSARNALDEAFGDYLAASYSAALGGTFNSGEVFNWDGHNQYWNGRVVNSNKKYPADTTGSFYVRSGLWSALLWDIHNEIGGPATDSLIYEAHYNYASNMREPMAATLLINADLALTGGKYYCPIYKHLVLRGIQAFDPNNPCGFTGINDAEEQLPITFMQQPNSFTIVNGGNEPLSFEVLNITGQQVTGSINADQPAHKYENEWLPSGMYLVAVHYGRAVKVFKWIKHN